jgi:hypothetical protein
VPQFFTISELFSLKLLHDFSSNSAASFKSLALAPVLEAPWRDIPAAKNKQNWQTGSATLGEP